MEHIHVFYPIVKSAGSNGFLELEQAPFTRFVQPAPGPRNTAKCFAVYQKQHDGAQNAQSFVMAWPGSPVQLEPNLTYILTPQIEDVADGLTKARTNVPQDQNEMRVLVTDEYQPQWGSDDHFFFTSRDTNRMPRALSLTSEFMRFPNPGKRKLSLFFRTDAGGCTATVEGRFSAGFATTAAQNIIVGAGESVAAVGTLDVIPLEWNIILTKAAGPFPTRVSVFVSFHDIET
jgi:hypothetical protein